MILVYVDGGVRKKFMYIGVLSLSSSIYVKFSKKLDKGVSHTSEELALITGLKFIKDLDVKDNVIVYSDQESLVEAINSDFNSPKIFSSYPHLEEIKMLLAIHSNIEIKWIKSKSNIAHSLVTRAYKDIFFNEITLISNNLNSSTSDSTYCPNDNNSTLIEKLDILTKEIFKKDIVINDLMKLISKLINLQNKI